MLRIVNPMFYNTSKMGGKVLSDCLQTENLMKNLLRWRLNPMFGKKCSIYSSIKGSTYPSPSALWKMSTAAMFSKDSIMAFFKDHAMKWMGEATEILVVVGISMYLHERFNAFLGDHWMSRWFFTMIIEFLIKKTLTFMQRGLATAVQHLTVHQSLRNILSRFQNKKIFPEVTYVAVV